VYVQAALLVFPSEKNVFTPLELLKHCIILTGDFWDVRAFFLPLFSAFWVGNSRGISNGILEATSIRGWFKLNCPFLLGKRKRGQVFG